MPRGVRYRPIPGFAGYRAGSDGSIWCNRPRGRLTHKRQNWPWRQLQAFKKKTNGYWAVSLSINNKPKQCMVHVLVLLSFRGTAPPGKLSRHRDGDQDNNRLSNLMYATQKVNIADKKKHGTHRFGEDANGVKLTAAKVRAIRRRVAAGESRRLLAEEFAVDRSTIHALIQRRTWAHIT